MTTLSCTPHTSRTKNDVRRLEEGKDGSVELKLVVRSDIRDKLGQEREESCATKNMPVLEGSVQALGPSPTDFAH